MDAATRRIEGQARLVETLAQRLAFELLLLRRMRAKGDTAASCGGRLTLRDIRLRALDRQARGAVGQAARLSARGEVLSRGVE